MTSSATQARFIEVRDSGPRRVLSLTPDAEIFGIKVPLVH
jgi:hypothetical protein